LNSLKSIKILKEEREKLLLENRRAREELLAAKEESKRRLEIYEEKAHRLEEIGSTEDQAVGARIKELCKLGRKLLSEAPN
jgi:hypothetical protein